MRHILVRYRDSDGYEGTTTIDSEDPMSQVEIVDILEEQLRASNIDSKIIYLDTKEVNKVQAKVTHFIRNFRP